MGIYRQKPTKQNKMAAIGVGEVDKTLFESY